MPDSIPDGYIPISVATLSPDASLSAPVYLRAGPQSPTVLYFSEAKQPDAARLRDIAKEKHNKLFIHRDDRDKYQQYLRDNLKTIAASQPVEVRVAMLGEVMRDVLSHEFATRDTDRMVLATRELSQSSSQMLGTEPLTLLQLCSVLHHDYATFTHVTNVAMYCALLARELGYTPEEIEEITLGGLLHDLGKLYIDETILNKPGKLDATEFAEIKKHPTIGFRELAEREDLKHGQLMMCYQHHERLDGSGYPVGCTADEIHPWAKLCAVVDVFEAITSQRPYRAPMSFKTALSVLERGRGTEFDPSILDAWGRLVFERSGCNV